MLSGYPRVASEVDTLTAVLAGKSLARYGDGEFKLCYGGGIKSQVAEPRLQARLREILRDSGACLVGIPNLLAPMPAAKAAFWAPYRRSALPWLTERAYVSAFVSRPDSAPWIDTDPYWAGLEGLWRDHDVTLVRGSTKSLTAGDLIGARAVTEIVCKRQHAYAEYAAIVRRIGRPARALLCLGPTATVLAADLCARGVHAIDLGHVGMFLRKRRRGEPMTVTAADKVAV
jgi:hypothetical protein